MNQNSWNNIQFNLSGIGCWLTLMAMVWILGLIGLGWLVKSLFALITLLLVAPIIGFLGLRWWLQRNLVQSQCPVCSYELTGLNGTQLQCPSCGEVLKAEKGIFQRLTPSGTIDVDAVEVQARQIQESESNE
ncbi:MAG: hypothetical protein F6K19_04230 [Cyanothece sp. SIO1E1]|nr:hypothetical protein [Cyanothece sp. SIO1E1]